MGDVERLLAADGLEGLGSGTDHRVLADEHEPALPNGFDERKERRDADTFRRVFQRLDPDEFMKCMSGWVSQFGEETNEQIIGINGQTLRAAPSYGGCQALHLVRAWASANNLVLGRIPCEAKSNEITAIPKLLRLIEIHGAIVTIDAMGCQTEIAKTIREEEADYVLPVKGNQPSLEKAIAEAFEKELECETEGKPTAMRHCRTIENQSGREEERHYYMMPAPKDLKQAKRWTDLKTIGMVVPSSRAQWS